MSQQLRWACSALIIFVIVVPCLHAQQEKVFQSMTPEATEKVLQSLKIEFKKTSSKKGDEHYYDFPRDKFRVRLTFVSPKEFMLDCVFRGIPLEKVNEWNTITRLSRVSLKEEGSGSFTMLEYGLDLSGGVTEGTIKQFILRFDSELKGYAGYLNENVLDTTILKQVTDDKVENVLKSLGFTYQKKQNASGVTMFDFQFEKQKLRLYNFGGHDLMMDAHFRKISLEDANKYNLERKFIRVVNYKAKTVEYTALEVNFDCEAGVTEGMIRNWIMSYTLDVRHFSEYAKGLQAGGKK